MNGAKGFQSFHESNEADLRTAAAARLTEGLGEKGQLRTEHEKPTRCASTFHSEFDVEPSILAEVFQTSSIGTIRSDAGDPRLPGLTLFFCEGLP